MSNSVKPENLEKALMDYLNDYVEDIEEGVEETTDTLTKQAVDELKQTSPRGRRGRYAKGWTKTKDRKFKGKYVVKIHNKTDYQLTHLLEFGHAKRNGGRTRAFPHIRPVEEKYNKLYEEKIITVIRRRSK